MKKFAIDITAGDDSNILGTYDTKEKAMNAGISFRENNPGDESVISCIEADFDENNKIIGNGYRLHKVFF